MANKHWNGVKMLYVINRQRLAKLKEFKDTVIKCLTLCLITQLFRVLVQGFIPNRVHY